MMDLQADMNNNFANNEFQNNNFDQGYDPNQQAMNLGNMGYQYGQNGGYQNGQIGEYPQNMNNGYMNSQN